MLYLGISVLSCAFVDIFIKKTYKEIIEFNNVYTCVEYGQEMILSVRCLVVRS